tara:strand:+ start:199 stop:690 length:492 start_codon:yes stop_codon:yes gene_type:complete
MVCYITFSIDGRELMINENKPEDIKIYTKSSKWRQIKILTNNLGYKLITICSDNSRSQKQYKLYRVNYFAHNPSWDIKNSSYSNCIDHIDRDKTNNKIENLRVVTHQENNFNRGAKGCSYSKTRKKWIAQIKRGNKRISLGSFTNENDAINAYKKAKQTIHKI